VPSLKAGARQQEADSDVFLSQGDGRFLGLLTQNIEVSSGKGGNYLFNRTVTQRAGDGSFFLCREL